MYSWLFYKELEIIAIIIFLIFFWLILEMALL